MSCARLPTPTLHFVSWGLCPDYMKVMGAFLSVLITAAFIFGPAVVEYL